MKDQLASRYDGCIEPWKVKLALARIKAFGFPSSDWPDLLQQLVISMLAFRFDRGRAHAAKESTALCTLINNQLTTLLRAEQRRRDRETRHRAGLGLSETNGDGAVYEETTDLRLDVRLAVAGLPMPERAACRGLMRGDSIVRIAENMDRSWHAARRLVDRARKRLEAMGLDGWVRG